ncbi:hypothetical protein Tcur_2678 [Thermomonospora curvata DSM 43183]|uniref:Uncharacterized protein n=1 Tax=Thermomonospora curvata (strain ATCC 19995 / DSM 43183 / JCM 3096 / KCTC 9072 / NBRC 15933 / NCIMB 10081 / Henssen B9) TaxID=471852 RepID=D1A5T5_THECD|nr:hypothetical protein Tcur_2678 [Thermomonospora curvata DSM 43183]
MTSAPLGDGLLPVWGWPLLVLRQEHIILELGTRELYELFAEDIGK